MKEVSIQRRTCPYSLFVHTHSLVINCLGTVQNNYSSGISPISLVNSFAYSIIDHEKGFEYNLMNNQYRLFNFWD